MASIRLRLSLNGTATCKQLHRPINGCSRKRALRIAAHKVEIEHEGQKHEFEVEDVRTVTYPLCVVRGLACSQGQSILEVALDSGLELPHDCRLGVSGEVDQSGSMLSEDVAGKGYALLCVSEPLSDCKIKTIDEEELLNLQLKTSEY